MASPESGPNEIPKIFESWAQGWALTRGTAAPIPTSFGLYLAVGQPSQAGRHIVLHRDASVEDLAASIQQPYEFIKVCQPAEQVASRLPRGWLVEPPVYLMVSLAPPPAAQPPAVLDAYTETLHFPRSHTLSISLHDREGALAASGKVSVVAGSCIFDQVVTDPAHRRRGLGTHIMRRLSSVASEHGASQGILVATEPGRALYEPLGWTVCSPVTSAFMPPE